MQLGLTDSKPFGDFAVHEGAKGLPRRFKMDGSGHVSAGENGDATATAMVSSKLGSDL